MFEVRCFQRKSATFGDRYLKQLTFAGLHTGIDELLLSVVYLLRIIAKGPWTNPPAGLGFGFRV